MRPRDPGQRLAGVHDGAAGSGAPAADRERPLAAPSYRPGPRPLGFHLALAAGLDQGPLDPAMLLGQERRAPGPPSPPAGTGPLFHRFVAGLHAYWRHPYRRRLAPPVELGRLGRVTLHDYAPANGRPLLVVPSLVNRAYVLDLDENASLLRFLAGEGFRPILLDWGEPAGSELAADLAAHVLGPLSQALDRVRAAAGPPVLIGYCMGGLLALALAQHRQVELRGLVLLATPWDFRAGDAPDPLTDTLALHAIGTAASLGYLPAETLQVLFAIRDPRAAVSRLAGFPDLDPASPQARRAVVIEDWVHDGVPLPGPAAIECFLDWYLENRTAAGRWTVGGERIRPGTIRLPSLVVAPQHDRVVPNVTAEPLADALPEATLLRPGAGHVGMVVGSRAPAALWHPLARWLGERF